MNSNVERLTLPAGFGRAVRLNLGDELKVINTFGTQVADTWAFDPIDPSHYMSMEVSRRHMLKIIPRPGDRLFSNRREPLLTFAQDTSPGAHDTLFTCCDTYLYRFLGCRDGHRNCADNLKEAMRDVGLAVEWVPAPLNLFMNIPVRDNLHLSIEPPLSRPGDFVTLRAERACIIALSSCPQDMMPINGGGAPADMELEVTRAAIREV